MILLKYKKLNVVAMVVLFSLCISFVFVRVKVVALKNDSDFLIGKTIYIDAGHGGKDNGANVDNIVEDAINMKISGYLMEMLIDCGAYVLMSRTSDYDLASNYNKNRKREDLNNRVKYINSSKPDLFISIHLNAYPSGNVSGAQVFYQDNDKSKVLSNAIQNKLNILTNKKRKNKIGDFYILNKTYYTGVLVECGFLSNGYERVKLNDDKYQMKIAMRIKEGILEYFQLIK